MLAELAVVEPEEPSLPDPNGEESGLLPAVCRDPSLPVVEIVDVDVDVVIVVWTLLVDPEAELLLLGTIELEEEDEVELPDIVPKPSKNVSHYPR
jgi:hypothetical protein